MSVSKETDAGAKTVRGSPRHVERRRTVLGTREAPPKRLLVFSAASLRPRPASPRASGGGTGTRGRLGRPARGCLSVAGTPPDAPPRALRGAGPLTQLLAAALGAPPFLLLLLLQPSSCPAASDLLSVFYSLPFFDFSTGNTFRVPRASQTQLEAPSCTLSQPPRSAASRVDIAQRSRDSVLNQSADSARASPSVPGLAWDPVQDRTQHAVSLSLPQSETLPRPLCVTTLALPRVTGRLFCRVLLRLGLANASSRPHSG